MITSKAAAIRVLLIDDHAVLRAGLANLLRLQADVDVVGEAGDGLEGIRLWDACHPDVGLVDVIMDGLDGVETVRRIRKACPDARLVMLTSSESSLDAARSLDAGAAAYITKHSSSNEIIDLIRKVYAGQTGIHRGVRPNAVAAPGRPELLSERELAVLQLMRKGCGNREIGQRLGIAERTVKCHVTAIFAKVGAKDRAGAVARGFDLGLLEAEQPKNPRFGG
jgi:NarL family two-component system response regulator LiaR